MEERSAAALLNAELRARRVFAAPPFDKAVWSLMLGEPDEGLRILREHLTDSPAEGRPGILWPQLFALVGDWERAAEAAQEAVRESLPGYVPGYRDYVAAMLSLVAGDDDQARTQLVTLGKFVARHDRLRSGHPAAVADIPRGLLERSAERVATGLEALLAWHLRRARARSEIFNSARAVISLEAIVALLVAQRRALPVPVAPGYRAAQLPLLAIHLTEWEGDPLPRSLPLSIETDLVAEPWLQAHGIAIGSPPARTEARPARRAPPRRPPGGPDVDDAIVRQSLRIRERAGGSAWQLASWALMLGDVERAHAHLRTAAEEAEREWRASVPQASGLVRWLRRSQALPNHNRVREHFALALVLGDEQGLVTTIAQVQARMTALEDDERRRGRLASMPLRYAHADGYLDLLCDLIAPKAARPTRDQADPVGGPLPSTRVACIGLVERDPALLARGLDGMLEEHARTLERRSSPPAPVCAPAVHVAAAARRLGVPVNADARYARHLVPIEIRDLPGYPVRVGRLPCDLLGTALWDR